ncbi:hypothetical protein O1D97_10815 [Marinomonas sp. 15G1-11]|mgnify:CR=1 FL=1|uniref:Uncharacterized protein n=1 Tax=Marinomonas phaeophyticola TaxID=3004091 RepID=A0ABT4JV87_9GAMM|nr:hypothetical protein [Marinomonas sp. 15G1-11]MCZ2722126.1 hypothetical protein [Marinomonas sp. 15G1-11]
MKRFTVLNTLIIGTLLSAQVSATEFFSHTIVNLPNGLHHNSASSWSNVINSQAELETFYNDLPKAFNCYYNNLKVHTELEENPNLPRDNSCQFSMVINTSKEPEIPTIDFEQFTFVLGGITRNSGCHSLNIYQVSYSGNDAYISAEERIFNGICSMAITYPNAGLLIRKTAAENIHISMSQYSYAPY